MMGRQLPAFLCPARDLCPKLSYCPFRWRTFTIRACDSAARRYRLPLSDPPSRRPYPPVPQCGIVYCLSRAECERVADELEAQLAEGIFPLRNGRRRVK